MAGEDDRPRRSTAAAIGHGFAITGRGLGATGRGIGRGWRRVMVWNRSAGAGESGLARLVEAHALQAAGDAVITVALAGSLFFSVPTGQARTRVALYLLVTMAPFAVLAPVLGPLLDRFRHGRRFAIAATMLARATLGVIIGHAVSGQLTLTQQLALYPAALGVLVCIKTYSVARSAAVPRVLPSGMTLVQANSRLTLAGVIAPGIGGTIAIGITKAFGHLTALRFGGAIYVIAAVLALRLPRRVDGGRETTEAEERPALGGVWRLGQVDPEVAAVLRSTAALRWLSGFLLFFGAFVVRAEHGLGGLAPNVSLAALAVGLGVGNVFGTMFGARVPPRAAPRLDVVLLVITLVTTVLATIDFGLITVFAVAVVSSTTVAIAKIALDATIQRRIRDEVRTSTFARSETTLQLAWVLGGGVGILLPTRPALGFAVASAFLAVSVVVALGYVGRRHPTNVTSPLPEQGDVKV
ncbi:MAG TPA: MFS transporter [Mycobacteriales bacterium]|nr:MFS transporter [Mycobacteriales bacterium]